MFWFTIQVEADRGQPTHDLLSLDAGLAGLSALIVDDNATLREVLAEYLTDWGMVVSTVDTSQAALAALRSAVAADRPFDVSLIDLSMPGMDGLELKDAIINEPSITARLVLMTDLGQERDLGMTPDPGICASLSKPIHREGLRTCLRLALHLQASDVPNEGAIQSSSPSGATDEGLLLLAEDNLINQKVAVAILRNAGYHVDTVPNGAVAVQAAAARPYDAILMDCQMPELNGYEATAAIREQEGSTWHTPIIALTAGARKEDRERCLAEGMDDYLSKPVNKDALLALVAQSVKNRPAAIDPLQDGGHARAAGVVIDHAALDEHRSGAGTDREILGQLIGQFVQETQIRLAQIGTALAAGDALAVGRITHDIRESCGQIGGRRLALSCSRLERSAATGRLAEGQTDLRAIEVEYQELQRALTEQVSAEHAGAPGYLHV